MASNSLASLIFFFFFLLGCCSTAVLSVRKQETYTLADQQESFGVAKPCEVQFDKVDFSSVTAVCKGPDYKEAHCCAAFQQIACKYKKHVNDFTTSCPVEFMAFLNFAGEYPHGIFVDRCTPKQLLCNL